MRKKIFFIITPASDNTILASYLMYKIARMVSNIEVIKHNLYFNLTDNALNKVIRNDNLGSRSKYVNKVDHCKKKKMLET